MTMMSNSYSLAESTHKKVNETIKYCTDIQQYNILENWTLPRTGLGDCEDYALLKRKILIDAGVLTKIRFIYALAL